MKRILFVMLLLVTCWAGAAAQEKPAPEEPKGFLGLDVFAGAILNSVPNANDEEGSHYEADGFDAGATVRFVRWLGITGTFGRHSFEGVPTYHVLVGPQVNNRYVFLRGFAHALVGFAHTGGGWP